MSFNPYDGPALHPVIHTERGTRNPTHLYFSIRRLGSPSFLLQSASSPGEEARYSVIGYEPLLYLRIEQNRVVLEGEPRFRNFAEEEISKTRGDALETLKKAMGFGKISTPTTDPRYALSCVGYLAYDYVLQLLGLNSREKEEFHHPLLEFMLPSKIVVVDHIASKTHFVRVVFDDENTGNRERVEREIDHMTKIGESTPSKTSPSTPTVMENMGQKEFELAVERAKEYIRAGDIIQVVLSRRLDLRPSPDLEQFFLQLINLNPSPYMFFLDFPARQVVGSSPEILVRVSGREVTTRPIAGTRRRGRNPEDEHRMEADLVSDEKERAEHVMLVDLGRNDIGKVAEFGSVRVEEFMQVEKYSHVQHLVSHVVGRLKPDRDAFDTVRATFPAGTVTGAPKVRAMEIIEELEPAHRGIYAGAIGSFSYSGDADLAIAIRTLVVDGNRASIQVGAGVVADSIPWKEHYETQNKAKALLVAAGVDG